MSVSSPAPSGRQTLGLTRATIRFAGDSGDGMQLTGMQFTNSSAIFGNDVSTLPDFPAEIRAPAGTVYGVSGYQLHFSSEDVFTPGDDLDCLVAMNAAALKVNLGDLKRGGILIVNEDGFSEQNLKLVGYTSNPLTDGSMNDYRVHPARMTEATVKACEPFGVVGRDAQRCKNFFALGIVCWLYGRPLEPIHTFINSKFAGKDAIRDANLAVLQAGYNYGETAEIFQTTYKVEKAKLPPGLYREIQGNTALALGLVTASTLSGKPLFYSSYPITPASDILHELSRHKEFGVKTMQAEDEIAAITSVIGAAYGGALAATATAGPGMALKAEGIGLAVMMELPLIVINVQRGGPSTGLPTKVEQTDLLQAIHGRNGECPVVVLSPSTPADCFDTAILACRVALRSMTPVVILSDGFLANSAEPWKIPSVDSFEPIEVEHPLEPNGENGTYLPYLRNEDLARPWALPGTPELMHRLGGLEKADITGNVSYDAANHQKMVNIRQAKVDHVATYLPEQTVYGDENPDLMLVGWGGTYGALREATAILRARGHKVGHVHVKALNPFPRNLGTLLQGARRVMVCELNSGQLRQLIRAKYLVDAHGYNKVQGRPFSVTELVQAAGNFLTEPAPVA